MKFAGRLIFQSVHFSDHSTPDVQMNQMIDNSFQDYRMHKDSSGWLTYEIKLYNISYIIGLLLQL